MADNMLWINDFDIMIENDIPSRHGPSLVFRQGQHSLIPIVHPHGNVFQIQQHLNNVFL